LGALLLRGGEGRRRKGRGNEGRGGDGKEGEGKGRREERERGGLLLFQTFLRPCLVFV